MARAYMLDTNTAGYFVRGGTFLSVRRRLVKVPMGRLVVSAVTEGELRYGVARRPDAKRLPSIVDVTLITSCRSAVGF